MRFRLVNFPVVVLIFFIFFIATLQAQERSIADELYPVVIEQGVDKAITVYHDLKKNSPGKFKFDEAELNNLGYRLLGEDKRTEAIEILKLNCELFPDSPNAFDSLGEAYLRLNYFEKSKESYSKVLSILENKTINEQLKKFLFQNAQSKLDLLNHPDRLVPSRSITDFIPENAEFPFGKIHPDAPQETEQWGQLAGIWKCTPHVIVNGQWVSGWPAIWAWKYILDGFAVQDIWLQDIKNLPPSSANLNRHFVGTNIRIYDRFKKKWEAVWFHNRQLPGGSGDAMSQFEAVYENERIIMTPVLPPAEGQPMRRIVFYNMKKNTFDWNSENSDDGGKTWKPVSKISAVRIQ